jgi:hypothetical protein
MGCQTIIAPEQDAARSDVLSALRASLRLIPRASSLTYKKDAVSNAIAPEQNTVRSDALSALNPSLRQGSSERLSETLALTQNTVRRYVCSPWGRQRVSSSRASSLQCGGEGKSKTFAPEQNTVRKYALSAQRVPAIAPLQSCLRL